MENLRLTWWRCPQGFEIAERSLDVGESSEKFVVPIGNDREAYTLMGARVGARSRSKSPTGLDMVLQLVNATDASGILQFANDWGPPSESPVEQLSAFLELASNLRRAVSDHVFEQAFRDEPRIDVGFEGVGGEKLLSRECAQALCSRSIERGIHYINAQSLVAFCWWQLAGCFEREISFQACLVCDAWHSGRSKLCGSRECRSKWKVMGPAWPGHCEEKDRRLARKMATAFYSLDMRRECPECGRDLGPSLSRDEIERVLLSSLPGSCAQRVHGQISDRR